MAAANRHAEGALGHVGVRLLGAALAAVIACVLALVAQVALLGLSGLTLLPGFPTADTDHGLLGVLALGASGVAQFAAALAGAVHAMQGWRGRAGAAFVMATTTYLVGVLFVLIQLAGVLSVPSRPPAELLWILVIFGLNGLFLAGPLYPVCLAGAWLWVTLMQRVAGSLRSPTFVSASG